ncbi:unnamed protein product [Rhizoctonia solani]|uniref:Uncharacterized protein n=1 Tax=Rhizoctonia solani TaxID=456999 RepID=A0A8H3E5A7_9AGAM|nr:unnamed protein product [Rhizoctonia solani]
MLPFECLSGCVYVASSCSLCTTDRRAENLDQTVNISAVQLVFFTRVHPYGQLDTSHRVHNRVSSSWNRTPRRSSLFATEYSNGGERGEALGKRSDVGKPSTKANPGIVYMAGRPLSCENDRPSQLFAQPEFSLPGLVSALGARASRISEVWVRGLVEAQAHGPKAEPEPQIRGSTLSARPLNDTQRLDAAPPRAHAAGSRLLDVGPALEEAENAAECGSRTQWLYERHNGPRRIPAYTISIQPPDLLGVPFASSTSPNRSKHYATIRGRGPTPAQVLKRPERC